MTVFTDNQPLLKQAELLETRLKEIPPEPGIYFMRDETGGILYIGKSKKLRSQIQKHRTLNLEITQLHMIFNL